MAKAAKPIKKAKAKTPKPRASKYEDKLVINGSFEQLVKELVTPKPVNKSK